MDYVFDANWKEEVEENVNSYSNLSEEVADALSCLVHSHKAN